MTVAMSFESSADVFSSVRYGVGEAGSLHTSPLSRAAIMWEWQRRDPAYIAFATGHPSPRATLRDRLICRTLTVENDARQWGCLFAEGPETPAPAARIFWTRDRDPTVLQVIARRSRMSAGNSFDVQQLAERVAHVTDMEGHEYLLVGTAASCLRLDVIDGTLVDGPVELVSLVPGPGGAAPALRAVGLLTKLRRQRCLPPGPSISMQMWRRDVARLQAFDALRSGATQREIGELIFGGSAVRYGWDGHTDQIRSAVKRLTRDARLLAAGGYQTMLF